MGICISRRAMQANNDLEAEDMSPSELPSSRLGTGGSSSKTDVLNPARLLLESPRISTDLGEMGMLGLLFHKKYCKSSSSSSAAATAVARTSSGTTQCDKARAAVPTMMNANVLFEYPAPFNDEKESEVAKRRQEQRWVSAGEEFYGDWEAEVAAGHRSGGGGAAATAAELGVFEAEQYFKDDSGVPCRTQQQPALPPPPLPLPPPAPSMLLMQPKQDESRRSSTSDCSSFKRASSATSASGMWASCASASAVEIEEEASPAIGKRKGKGKELSRAFFKLLSASSSPAHRHQATKARKSTDGHVKDWMDKARKSLDEICSSSQGQAMVDHQAFGSPFPGSPNSESRRLEHGNGSEQAAASATEQEQQGRSTGESTHGQKEEQGNDSDSSSDLFELDSVATSLSSARSSLSRLSSARSSIRKSTADEQDFSSFKESPSSQLNSSQHDSKPATGAARRRRPSNGVPSLVESRSVRAEDKAGKPPLVRPKPRSDHALLGGSRLNPWNNSSNGVLAVQT